MQESKVEHISERMKVVTRERSRENEMRKEMNARTC